MKQDESRQMEAPSENKSDCFVQRLNLTPVGFHLQALDYETKKDYEFRVEVRNTYLDARFIHGLQFKDYATVRVTVEDVDEPPVFTRNPYVIEVHEDTAAGSFVGVVSARDLDADKKAVK